MRGPDGIAKEHVVKYIVRYLRRSILVSAFDGRALHDPWEAGGGSFTGPWPNDLAKEDAIKEYLRHIDELPHHFQLHFMHAAEIIGYDCPFEQVRGFWYRFYRAIVKDAHLEPESHEDLNRRLGDNEQTWRDAEVVTAR